ncbi:hypothetical protein CRG98_006932 [Punica granatum]|uniref:Uncharacterized protein n=1 Tax=Punica granatum TaxID=22663 RepID=A0A2I0KW42_PUNGR|nr:hypothetical protein CRG98_006932 [Punica granatum]
MSKSTEQTPQILSATVPLRTSETLISIKLSSQLPIKLTTNNYASWKTQFNSLLVGYDLVGYINGSFPCPLETITRDGQTIKNSAYILWRRQDQLLLHAIIVSVSEGIMGLIPQAKTSAEAWATLGKLYANRSRSRIMSLKETLAMKSRGTQTVQDYLQSVKAIADELVLAGALITSDDRESSRTDGQLITANLSQKKGEANDKFRRNHQNRGNNYNSERGSSPWHMNARRQDQPSQGRKNNHNGIKCQLCDRFGQQLNNASSSVPIVQALRPTTHHQVIFYPPSGSLTPMLLTM